MGQAFKKRNATSSIEEAADLLIYRSVGWIDISTSWHTGQERINLAFDIL